MTACSALALFKDYIPSQWAPQSSVDALKLRELKALVGGSLSKPSKMPGWSYGIPAAECKTGSFLAANDPDSICANCYAMKGMYRFRNVQAAQYARLATISTPLWVPAMTRLIAHYSSDVFRWHDSGDLQSVAHLAAICEIARRLPDTKFWLPTREYDMVARYRRRHTIPPNLTVRLSAFRVGAEVDAPPELSDMPTSGAHKGKGAYTSGKGRLECQAYRRGGECGSCRACWSPTVSHVSYPEH